MAGEHDDPAIVTKGCENCALRWDREDPDLIHRNRYAEPRPMIDMGPDSPDSADRYHTTTTTTTSNSRPKLVPDLQWSLWPGDEEGEDGKYLVIKAKLEDAILGNQMLDRRVIKLSHQVDKLTEMVANMVANMGLEVKPSLIKSPGSGFTKVPMDMVPDGAKINKREAENSPPKTIFPQTAKVDAKVDKAGAEDSPPKIIFPRTAKVARFEIQFASPDKVPKECNSEPPDMPSSQIGLTSPEQALAKSVLEPSDTTSSFTTSPEESEERNFASPDENSPLSLQNHKAEESAPELSGESSSPSLSFEESELGGPAEGGEASQQAKRLATHDALFAYFRRYLTNPNHSRQITTQRDEAAHLMARSFKSAVCNPSRKAAIARSEFDDMRATIRQMNDSSLVDLYIALSQRYREEYRYDN